MTTVQTTAPRRDHPVRTRLAQALLASSLLAAGSVGGCATSTNFLNEGPGQPSDRATGTVPAGSIGVCKLPFSMRPPIVSEAFWENAPVCRPKTPRRFIRIGFGKQADGPDKESEERMKVLMEALKQSVSEENGNAKMLVMLRTVRQQAADRPELSARIERSSGRTFSCDYHYLLTTTHKHLSKQGEAGKCAARAYDPVQRDERCLFDTSLNEAVWLTSAWGCVAFTGTVGEGQSCYRLCDYDDHCAAQVSCSNADLDLLLCALGVCLPEKVAGVY
jgi:hypothetical protein